MSLNLNTSDIAKTSRLETVKSQGIGNGASPPSRNAASVVAVETPSSVSDSGLDWRVSLKVPSEISDSPVFSPLSQTGDRMVFPLNPTIVMSQRSNYQSITPTHTNYAFHAYQGSQVDDILVTGDFFVQNSEDASYWIACVHFLRTMNKMFYGNGEYLGNPPLVTRLNGYGKYVFNNIPVLITNFTVDMTSDVDYIPCEVPGDTSVNYVPAQSQFSVTCTPNYSRRAHSQFNLKDFANGQFIGKEQGFV